MPWLETLSENVKSRSELELGLALADKLVQTTVKNFIIRKNRGKCSCNCALWETHAVF